MKKKWNLISLYFLSLSTNAATNFIDWDHFYLGINLGPMFENSILSAYQNSIVSPPYYNQTLHRGTFFIGGQIGKLYRYNRFLLTGFEVDVDSLNVSQNYNNSEEPQSPLYDQFKIKNQLLATFRLRLGFDIGWNYLPYFTVGPSINRMGLSYQNNFNDFYSSSTSKVGVAGGAGIDYHWTEQINFRCEYLYNYMAGAASINIPSIHSSRTDTNGSANATMNASFVRFGFNVMF